MFPLLRVKGSLNTHHVIHLVSVCIHWGNKWGCSVKLGVKDNLQESVLSHVGPKAQTRVIKLGSAHLYPLN